MPIADPPLDQKRLEYTKGVIRQYGDKIPSHIQQAILNQRVILGMPPFEASLAAGAHAFKVIADPMKWPKDTDPYKVIQAQTLHPDDSQIWMLKGFGFYSMKRFQDAIPCFQQAERLGDTSAARRIENCRSLLRQEAEKWFERGSDFQQAGNNAEAIRCYDVGLASDPSNADVWNNKGAALLALKRSSEAIACFDRALSLSPGDSSAWNNKGLALFFMEQYAAALPCLEEAQRLGATRCGGMIAACRDQLGKP